MKTGSGSARPRWGLALSAILAALLAMGCGTEGTGSEADPSLTFEPGTVEDRGAGLDQQVDGPVPSPGDRVLAVNGLPAGEWVEAMRPFQRYSTENGLWIVLAGEIDWEGHADRHYPGFSPVAGMDTYETYHLYLPDDEDLPLVLLQWHRFDRDLPDAMDTLMDYAREHDLLDRHVIVDATHSGGGSRRSYAVRRLQPDAHRGTFGNLKVSEAMERWVEDRIDRFHRGDLDPASEDDGTWKIEWLEEDVRKAIRDDRYYTNDVPFKGAHAPRWSDGIIEPHEYIPQTRDNHFDYHARLLRRTLERLGHPVAAEDR